MGNVKSIIEGNVKIVFMHIPKTAGTSLHNMLIDNFSPEIICPSRLNNLIQLNNESLHSYKYFSGHYDMYNVNRIPGPKFVFTFLRKPESRVVSLYHFWRAHKESVTETGNFPGPKLARRLSLLEFVQRDDAVISHAIDNYVVRILIGAAGPVSNSLESYKESTGLSNEQVVEIAFHNLLRFNFIGFQERFDEDASKLLAILGRSDQITIPNKLNHRSFNSHPLLENIERQQITKDVISALDKRVGLDQILYDRIFDYSEQLCHMRLM